MPVLEHNEDLGVFWCQDNYCGTELRSRAIMLFIIVDNDRVRTQGPKCDVMMVLKDDIRGHERHVLLLLEFKYIKNLKFVEDKGERTRLIQELLGKYHNCETIAKTLMNIYNIDIGPLKVLIVPSFIYNIFLRTFGVELSKNNILIIPCEIVSLENMNYCIVWYHEFIKKISSTI
ncbi:MAG: hypothetical protein GXO10_03185 [Crenarchaeota archaeon]|nr:hypothetical protein [Thermoproteota archaeon]